MTMRTFAPPFASSPRISTRAVSGGIVDEHEFVVLGNILKRIAHPLDSEGTRFFLVAEGKNDGDERHRRTEALQGNSDHSRNSARIESGRNLRWRATACSRESRPIS